MVSHSHMNREQAVGIIKQIFERCSRIEGKSIKLMPPKLNNKLSNTCQIHIQTRDDHILDACLTDIAKENGLDIKRKDDLTVIYKKYSNFPDQSF